MATTKTVDPVEEAKHAPISLPSGGSYDIQDLQKKLDKVVDLAPEKRDAAISKALDSASGDDGSQTNAPNAIPGHDVYKVETQLAAGSDQGDGTMVGGEVVTEFVQVYNPDRADEVGEVVQLSSQPSEILSMEKVGDAPEPAPVSPAPVPPEPTRVTTTGGDSK